VPPAVRTPTVQQGCPNTLCTCGATVPLRSLLIGHDRVVPGNAILITGPAASGKSTLARYVSQQLGWQCLSEDDYWVANGWGSGTRSLEQEMVVQRQVVNDLVAKCRAGRSVVLEFVVYSEPPNALSAYEEALTTLQVAFEVLALRPSVAEIIRRMEFRGRPEDLEDLQRRRREAERQVRVLEPDGTRSWTVLDTTDLTVGEICRICLQRPGWPRLFGSR
jgi:adenylate kinase family enzyme